MVNNNAMKLRFPTLVTVLVLFVISVSAKPYFHQMLSGIRSYKTGILTNGEQINWNYHPFVDEYIIRETYNWLSQICPDAEDSQAELGYATMHIYISYNHSTYMMRNGVTYWQIYNIEYRFEFGNDEKYVYKYHLDRLDVAGNNFGFHGLWRQLLDKIEGFVIHFNSSFTPYD